MGLKRIAMNEFTEFSKNGYCIIPDMLCKEEIETILQLIAQVDHSGRSFRKSSDLFAIRQLVKEIPLLRSILFKEKIQTLLNQIGSNYFLVKSIYFDKPPNSNWFVAYHQDLTISVDKKANLEGFGPWSSKNGYYAVQPPLAFLENIVTLRIHLDDTDVENGALRVIPGSHQKGLYRPETINWEEESEETCPVPKGGVMLMRPLLLHRSSRSTSPKSRRVIHLEFSSMPLPTLLKWEELDQMSSCYSFSEDYKD